MCRKGGAHGQEGEGESRSAGRGGDGRGDEVERRRGGTYRHPRLEVEVLQQSEPLPPLQLLRLVEGGRLAHLGGAFLATLSSFLCKL